jgi:hypothetical protein
VTNLDPKSTILSDQYVDAVDKLAVAELDTYGFEKFVADCAIMKSREFEGFENLSRFLWI